MKTNTERITAVKSGESIRIDHADFVVLPPCADNGGHWYCLTHKETFNNTLMKDFHTHAESPCHFVWICHTHGPEQP